MSNPDNDRLANWNLFSIGIFIINFEATGLYLQRDWETIRRAIEMYELIITHCWIAYIYPMNP